MTTQTLSPTWLRADRRSRRFGVFSLVLAAVMGSVFATGVGDQQARFVLNVSRGEPLFVLPDLLLRVAPTALFLALVVAGIGIVQLTRGFGRRSVLMVAVAAGLFVATFLTWAAAGQALSLIGLFQATLSGATPIAFGGLCGVLCERAGVINIAIEGQLLAGAFTAAVVSSAFSDPWMGLLGGVAAGVLIAYMLAGLTIHFRADQIVTGVVLIVLATGVTSFLTSQVLARNPQLNAPTRFARLDVPLLSDLPIVGPLLFRNTVLGYAMLLSVVLLHYGLFHTRWGLRLRSVGEHPKAADTVGIKVLATRYRAVLLGGLVAGLGGAWFTLDSVGQFSREMTGGRGFIALAAMLVGRYSPVGAFAAALLFGFADALSTSLQILRIPIPSTLLLTTPYVVTILVVAGLVGRLRPPAADGKPYIKE